MKRYSSMLASMVFMAALFLHYPYQPMRFLDSPM